MYGQHAGEVLIGIEFSQIEFRRSRVPFMARLIDLESQPGARDIQIRALATSRRRIVQYDPPATASFYVSQEKPSPRARCHHAMGYVARAWVVMNSGAQPENG